MVIKRKCSSTALALVWHLFLSSSLRWIVFNQFLRSISTIFEQACIKKFVLYHLRFLSLHLSRTPYLHVARVFEPLWIKKYVSNLERSSNRMCWSTAWPLTHLIFSSLIFSLSQRWIGLYTTMKKYLNHIRIIKESIAF